MKMHYTKSKRNIIAILLACLFILGAAAGLSSCSSYQDGAAPTGYAFVQAIADQDYSTAYDYIYSFSSDISNRQDFIDRYTNIYDALEISDIVLLDRNVEQKENSDTEYTLNYKLQLQSKLLGNVIYNYTTDIIASPLGYTVIYDPRLILPTLEDGDKVRVANQQGKRGEILTADGELLAKNDYAESIYVDLAQEPDIEEIKDMFVALLGYNADETAAIQKTYDSAVEKEYPTVVLAVFPRNTLTDSQISKIKEISGLGVDNERLTPTRYYPFADNAAHTVGYLGSPTDEEIASDNTLDEYSQIGKSGIELVYDETLRATNGRIIYIEDARGEQKEVLYEEPKTDGSDIYLTLDSNLQNTAYTLLASNCKAGQSGVVIIMDYTNGDVKAIVNYPSFDPNLFQFSVDPELYEYYEDPDNQAPLFSRATQALYMPGSTFKPFSSTPALESGDLNAESSPPLTIKKNENNKDIWNPGDDGFRWPYDNSISRVSTPTQFVFEECMKSSDNIFFAFWALTEGVDTMTSHMERIGMGEAPEFELPLAKSSYLNEGQEMDAQILAQTGFGMGQLQMTPVQMASMYTALMNNGDMLNPTIVKKISKIDGTAETVEYENSKTYFKQDTMSSHVIDMMKPALRRVITDGTAYDANLAEVETLIAKTGTARIGSEGVREVNWVVAIDTATELLYVVVVDTKSDEGTQPKLAILHGLVNPKNYDKALVQHPEVSAYSAYDNGTATIPDIDFSDSEDDVSDGNSGDTSNDNDAPDDRGTPEDDSSPEDDSTGNGEE